MRLVIQSTVLISPRILSVFWLIQFEILNVFTTLFLNDLFVKAEHKFQSRFLINNWNSADDIKILIKLILLPTLINMDKLNHTR